MSNFSSIYCSIDSENGVSIFWKAFHQKFIKYHVEYIFFVNKLLPNRAQVPLITNFSLLVDALMICLHNLLRPAGFTLQRTC